MPASFNVLNSSGGTVLSVANGTFFTGEIAGQYEKFQVFVEFFSNAACTVPATPTAGTITVSGTPMGNSYLSAANSVITATAVVTGGLSTYTAPSINGPMRKGRAILAGITGATHAKIIFWGA